MALSWRTCTVVPVVLLPQKKQIATSANGCANGLPRCVASDHQCLWERRRRTICSGRSPRSGGCNWVCKFMIEWYWMNWMVLNDINGYYLNLNTEFQKILRYIWILEGKPEVLPVRDKYRSSHSWHRTTGLKFWWWKAPTWKLIQCVSTR